MKILFKSATIGGKKVIRYFRDGREVARIETTNPIKTIIHVLKKETGVPDHA